MTNLRERQRAIASESVARERRAVAETEARAQAARQALSQQQAMKSALWKETVDALGSGACSVEGLRQATRWSRAIDGKVSEAEQGVAQAQSLVAQHNAILDKRVQVLRAATGNLEKAKEMHLRMTAQARRAADAAADEVTDEWAVQRWMPQTAEPRPDRTRDG